MTFYRNVYKRSSVVIGEFYYLNHDPPPTPPLIQDEDPRVETPTLAPLWTLALALLGGSQGIPRPHPWSLLPVGHAWNTCPGRLYYQIIRKNLMGFYRVSQLFPHMTIGKKGEVILQNLELIQYQVSTKAYNNILMTCWGDQWIIIKMLFN